MRAAVVTRFEKPLEIQELPVPEPTAGQMLVHIEANGLGHPYQAVKVGGIMPGDTVAIFGMGRLGHLALQYAQIFGGETIAVDGTEEKL